VAEAGLGVLLDQIVAGVGRGVRVDAERAHVQRAAQRPPLQRPVHHRQGRNVVDREHLIAVGHVPHHTQDDF
jgi:hypothetical protein